MMSTDEQLGSPIHGESRIQVGILVTLETSEFLIIMGNMLNASFNRKLVTFISSSSAW